MVEENPYAPPRTVSCGLPVAPAVFGWEVKGKAVNVKKTSQFPMIDPFTGSSEDPMPLQRVLVHYRPWWLLAFPLVGGSLMAVLGMRAGDSETAGLAIAGVLLGMLISGVVGRFLPVCTLHLFFEKRTLRFRALASRVVYGLLFVAVFAGFFTSAGREWISWVQRAALVGWLLAGLANTVLSRRLRCRRRAGERFAIHGFHPKALAALAETREPSPHA